jgi:hypothetical protein
LGEESRAQGVGGGGRVLSCVRHTRKKLDTDIRAGGGYGLVTAYHRARQHGAGLCNAILMTGGRWGSQRVCLGWVVIRE